jgi:glycosyltransferase involved in cell wall biosynthesis
MTILHTEEMGVIGGQSLRVLEDLKIIRELGYEPILACKGANWIAKEAHKLDIEVIDLPFKSRGDISTATQLFNLIRRRNIDIIHTHSSIDSYLATYPAKILGKKVVRSRHSELSKAPGHIYRIVDALVTTGEKVAEQFKRAGVQKPEIISIPSYPDEKYFTPNPFRRQEIRKNFGLDNSELVLGAMTGTAIAKGIDLLMQSFAALSSQYSQLKLLIAGNCNPKMLEELNRQAQKLQIDNKIEFLGYTDARDFLEAIDLYICPSKKEGVPQALIQAMMMGKACISTDVGSISELNIDDNLLLIPNGDSEALIKTLQRVIENTQLRQNLGEKNRLLAKKHFCRSVMKERMANLYESLGSK